MYQTTSDLLRLLDQLQDNIDRRRAGQPEDPIMFRTDPALQWAEGYAWQYLVCHAFMLAGAYVRYEYSVTLAQLNENLPGNTLEKPDGYVEFTSWPLACLIEAKDRHAPANADVVVILRAKLKRRPSTTIGCLFSTQGFSEPARVTNLFELTPPVFLWEPSEVRACLEQGDSGIRKGLERKMRYLALYGTPDPGIDFTIPETEL